MEILRLLLSIFTATFIGFNILYILAPKAALYRSERLALSYGIGVGFITLEMALFYIFNKAFNLAAILAPWAILLAVNVIIYLLGRNKNSKDESAAAGKGSAHIRYLDMFLALGITFEVLYAFFRALIKPMEAYDAIAIYAIRAKAFFIANTIPRDLFQNVSGLFPHPDYPLNIPLAETFGYLFLGSLNDQLIKMIFPLYFLGVLILVYFFIRRFASRTYSLLFTFILATIPQFSAQSTSGYIDVPLSYYASGSMLFIFLWSKDTSKTPFLWISAVMAGLSAWTKNEGLMYCAITTILLMFFVWGRKTLPAARKIILPAAFIAIIVLISSPWSYVKVTERLSNNEIRLSNLNLQNIYHNAGRMWDIAYEFQKQFLGPKKWNIIWIIFFVTFIVKIKRVFKADMLFMSLALLFTFGGYKLAYLITSEDVSWHLSSSASRLLLHFLPIIVCWLAVALKEEIKI